MSKVQSESTKNDPTILALPRACADEKSAVEFMEAQRWGEQPACPRCGSLNIYQMKDSKTGERQAGFRWRCRDCASVKATAQFTVRTGTVFEDSRIELRHWCFAFWRSATSKKGVSALEIHRQTGLCYKSSLFLLHRIRFAMGEENPTPLQGTVEVDEVYIGGKPRKRNNGPKLKSGLRKEKAIVLGMKERGGRVRPQVIADVTSATLKDAILKNIDLSARLMTDEASGYRAVGFKFHGRHETVKHSAYEYVRGDVHTNGIEGFWGQLRRGLDGIYHSVSKEHLHRYLAEFQFRHNRRELNDGERTVAAIKAAEGKRLTYKEQLGK